MISRLALYIVSCSKYGNILFKRQVSSCLRPSADFGPTGQVNTGSNLNPPIRRFLGYLDLHTPDLVSGFYTRNPELIFGVRGHIEALPSLLNNTRLTL